MEKKNNSLEFTVLRHKITVLAPFYSYPTTDLLVPSQNACSMTCVRSCCRASNLFAIHCKHDRFCSQVQVAMYRMQMLLHLRHFWQRCKYLFPQSFAGFVNIFFFLLDYIRGRVSKGARIEIDINFNLQCIFID